MILPRLALELFHFVQFRHERPNRHPHPHGIAGDKQRVGPVSRELCKSFVDLGAAAGVQDAELQANGLCRLFHLLQSRFSIHGIRRIHEHRNPHGGRHYLAQQLQPLCIHLLKEKIKASDIAAWPREVGNKAELDRIVRDPKHNGNR